MRTSHTRKTLNKDITINLIYQIKSVKNENP
jgi:hypothetical protein